MRCPCLETFCASLVSGCPQHGSLNIINCPFVVVSKQKWHSSSCSAGGDSIPKSGMIVGDKTSFVSGRVPTCSMLTLLCSDCIGRG